MCNIVSLAWYDLYAILLMLGLWNLFLMRLGLCFQEFLALLWFLILKTFNLKYLVGERFKGCISRSPLSVYSSVIKHLALAYMPCSQQRVFNSWYYRLNFLMMDDMCFYIKNDHTSIELLGDSHKVQAMVTLD